MSTELIDFYFSQTCFEHQMNKDEISREQSEFMALVKINGEYVSFSEQIKHGRTPMIAHRDLTLLATIPESKVDIIIIKKEDYK